MRISGRALDECRKIEFIPHFSKYPEGSCMVSFGDTKVICSATIEDKVPFFLRGSGKGWISAEYSMLPRATSIRNEREASKGKQSGRTLEIQRLVGRALRNAVDLQSLGERQIRIDCDVIQADGGTRTAAICGGCVALYLALKRSRFLHSAFMTFVSAVSCGVTNDKQVIVDLDYREDSSAVVDSNFVFTEGGALVEVQASGESGPFNEDQLTEMLSLAKKTAKDIIRLQKIAIQ